MSVIPFLRNKAFEPSDIDAMNRALLKVMADLGIPPDAPSIIKESLVTQIAHAARTGMRDPDKLAAFALRSLVGAEPKKGGA